MTTPETALRDYIARQVGLAVGKDEDWRERQPDLAAAADALAALTPPAPERSCCDDYEPHYHGTRWVQKRAALVALTPPTPALDAALAGALADLAYVVWGPGGGFDQPEGGRSSDGVTWVVPSRVRALLDRYAALADTPERSV